MSIFDLVRIGPDEWQELSLQWEAQSGNFSENFEDHASASMPVLEELALGPQLSDAGVFSFQRDGEFKVIAQFNATFLPGYTGKVLRVRHIVLSPRYELDEEITLDDYGEVLVGIFGGSLMLSIDKMPSDHVKFHLQSRAERMFGEQFKEALKESPHFKKVVMRGSWIYLSKA